MEQLKPCPFCGSENLIMHTVSGVMEYYYVECNNCCCRTEPKETEEIAIEAWNGRTENE